MKFICGKLSGLLRGLSTIFSVNLIATKPNSAVVMTSTSGICHLSGRYLVLEAFWPANLSAKKESAIPMIIVNKPIFD